MKLEFEVKDYSDQVLNEFKEKLQTALEEVGRQAEGNAKLELEAEPRRVSPNATLRNSITHKVEGNSVKIGTNLFYAPYVHEGTGIYAKNGTKTGKTWWVFVKGNKYSSIKAHGKRYSKHQAYQVMQYLKSKGLDAWMTQGQKPNRFLVNAIEKHKDDYPKIITTIMKN